MPLPDDSGEFTSNHMSNDDITIRHIHGVIRKLSILGKLLPFYRLGVRSVEVITESNWGLRQDCAIIGVLNGRTKLQN